MDFLLSVFVPSSPSIPLPFPRSPSHPTCASFPLHHFFFLLSLFPTSSFPSRRPLTDNIPSNLPALLHSISRNFTPRLQNVSRFKKFLAATRIMESLEDYALYLASVRLAPDVSVLLIRVKTIEEGPFC